MIAFSNDNKTKYVVLIQICKKRVIHIPYFRKLFVLNQQKNASNFDQIIGPGTEKRFALYIYNLHE